MAAFRADIGRGAPVEELRTKQAQVSALLDAAERRLEPTRADAGANFFGAFTILLREGLEAILIVVAMLVFLQKAERRELLPYVHGGWVAALAAGVATWGAATFFISISGASRELTEGVGSLLAAVVLISVGIWMHGRSQAQAWQTYIREKISRALSRRSAWFLFLLAFLVVYREVFETILFYVALWAQGGGWAMLAGAGAAGVCLAVIAWLFMTYSRRLPIAKFFAYSSVLIAILAVVLAGKGIAALQEAGWIDVRPADFVPRIDILGLFPTWEGVLGQAVVLALLIAGFWLSGRAAQARS
jgi:high-affinity iron transporter